MGHMQFDEYQEWTKTTWLDMHDTDDGRLHAVLGLSGEVGELVEKVKKAHRGDLGKRGLPGISLLKHSPELKKEIGDVMYYLARVCSEFGFSMGDVASDNRKKLEDRKARGVLKGSGDNR